MPSADKTKRMKEVRDEIINLKISPLYSYRTENNYFPVIGEGSHDAAVMFVGEAPGKNEAMRARPFCGAAGRVLDELLAFIEADRKDVYITNIVKDRPPDNRDPLPEEIVLYSPFLDRQIDIVQPKAIAALGRFSSSYILQKFGLESLVSPMSRLHGREFFGKTSYGDIAIIPLYHPAAALYNSSNREVMRGDFLILKKYLQKFKKFDK